MEKFKKENGLSNVLTQGIPITLLIGYLFLIFGSGFSDSEVGRVSMALFGAFAAAASAFVFNELQFYRTGEKPNMWECVYAAMGVVPGFIILRLYVFTDWSRHWIIVIIIVVFLGGLYVRKHPKK